MFTSVETLEKEWSEATKKVPKNSSVTTRCEWVAKNVPEYVIVEKDFVQPADRILRLVFPDCFKGCVVEFINATFPDVSRNSGSYRNEDTGYYSIKLNVFMDRVEEPFYEDCGTYS